MLEQLPEPYLIHTGNTIGQAHWNDSKSEEAFTIFNSDDCLAFILKLINKFTLVAQFELWGEIFQLFRQLLFKTVSFQKSGYQKDNKHWSNKEYQYICKRQFKSFIQHKKQGLLREGWEKNYYTH